MRVCLAFAIPDMALLSLLPPWPYPLLCPLAPRKGSWLADKVKRLMRPRREGGPHGGPRLGADGAGSTESLGGPPETELSEGREADGTGGSGGQVTKMVPTPWPLPPAPRACQCLWPSCVACTCAPRWPSLLQPLPIPPDGSSSSLPCIPAVSLLAGTSLLPALPPTPSYPTTAVPRTSEQQGTVVRSHLSQSADEETEAQGGETPCPRSHSELVSEPAQGPASCRHLHSPNPAPLPAPTSAAACPLWPLCSFSLLAPPLCPAPPGTASIPSLPVPLAGSPSPAPMRRAQSSLCLRDETLAGGQRRKLSSRFPVGRSSESFSPGDTPRQRFRQRRPGPLGAPSSHGKGEGKGPSSH